MPKRSDLVGAAIGLALLLGLRFYKEFAWLSSIRIPWTTIIVAGVALAAVALLWKEKRLLRGLLRTEVRRATLALTSSRGAIIIPDGGRYRACMAFAVSGDGDGGDIFFKNLEKAGIPYLYAYASSNTVDYGGKETALILLCSRPSKDIFKCLDEVERMAKQVEALASTLDGKVQLSLIRDDSVGNLLEIWKVKEESFAESGRRCLLKPKLKPRGYLKDLEESILLGRIIAGEMAGLPVHLSKRDILRHVAVFGSTGSGKTTTAATILLRLLERGVNVLVIDWHGEYSELAKRAGGELYTPGGDENSIVLNPFELVRGVDVEESLDLMVDFFQELFHLSHAQVFMLKEAVRNAYESALAKGSTPVLADVLQEVGMIPIRSGWDHETKMALLRRLKKLADGRAGKALNGPSTIELSQLFSGFKVVDLSCLSDLSTRSVVAATVLKLAYDYFTSLGGTEELRQVIVVEEASNVMPPRRREEPMGVGERVLMELRKFGVGIVVLAQSPTAISSEVLKNTSIKIVHALRSSEDLRMLPSLMFAEDDVKQLAMKLNPGEALVVSPTYHEPVVIRVEPPDIIWELPRERSDGEVFSQLTQLASLLDQA